MHRLTKHVGPGAQGAQHTRVGVRVITKPDSIDCYLGALAPSYDHLDRCIDCYDHLPQFKVIGFP